MSTNSLKIGITGGIGSGKSYVSSILRCRGFKVFDCDSESKRLMNTDMRMIDEIVRTVGPEAYIKSHQFRQTDHGEELYETYELNRRVMAEFVFGSEQNTQAINSIVHPHVAEEFRTWASLQHDDFVFMESAILFESGFNKLVDLSVAVVADKEIRISRVTKRDGSERTSVEQRMRHQTSTEYIEAHSDYIIHNDTNDDIESETDRFIQYINLQLKNRKSC